MSDSEDSEFKPGSVEFDLDLLGSDNSDEENLSEDEYSRDSTLSGSVSGEELSEAGSLGDSSYGSSHTLKELSLEVEAFTNVLEELAPTTNGVAIGTLVRQRAVQFCSTMKKTAAKTAANVLSMILPSSNGTEVDHSLAELGAYVQLEFPNATTELLRSSAELRGTEMGLDGLLVTPCRGGRFKFYFRTWDNSFTSLSLQDAMKYCKVTTVTLPHTQEARELATSLGFDGDTHGAYPAGGRGGLVNIYLPDGSCKQNVTIKRFCIFEEGGPDPQLVIGMTDGPSFIQKNVQSGCCSKATDPAYSNADKEMRENLQKLVDGEIDSFVYLGKYRITLWVGNRHPSFVVGKVKGQEQDAAWARLKPSIGGRGAAAYTLTKSLEEGKAADIGWVDCGGGTQMTHAKSGAKACIAAGLSDNNAAAKKVLKTLREDKNPDAEGELNGCTVQVHDRTRDGTLKCISERKTEAEAAAKTETNKTGSQKTARGKAKIQEEAPMEGPRALGCRCKKTKCLKKYCECFSNNTFCGDFCFCVNCKNVPNLDSDSDSDSVAPAPTKKKTKRKPHSGQPDTDAESTARKKKPAAGSRTGKQPPSKQPATGAEPVVRKKKSAPKKSKRGNSSSGQPAADSKPAASKKRAKKADPKL